MSEYSPRFHIDGPPKMTRRERARIMGTKAVIAGMQDVVLREVDPEQLTMDEGFLDHPQLFDPDIPAAVDLPEAI